MNGSWKIGTAFGIPIRLHFSMILLPLIMYNVMPMQGIAGLIAWLAVVVLLFGSVLLHEFGHALTARRFGIRTMDIILTPLGGMARVINLPSKPRHEIAIAIAGPLVSLTLAGMSFGAGVFAQIAFPPLPVIGQLVEGLGWVFYINLMLGIFNLVPALPMDGGRVLRGYLALKRDFLTATRIAVKVGRTIAIVGGVWAIYVGHYMLAVIAVFIYMSAGAELRMAQMREYQRRMAQGGFDPTGPFGAPSGQDPRVWTWAWPRSGPRQTGWSGPGAPKSQHQDWTRPDPDQEREVIVIDGGKVEIVSRKDPEDE